jgi:exonuclease III
MWMGSWQTRMHGNAIHVICIQETHVASEGEVAEVAALWARMWGRRAEDDLQLSYWSVSTARAAGVGILLHPDAARRFRRVDTPALGVRGLVIQDGAECVANVYAPNDRMERERFFECLGAALPTGPERLLVVGDFNCVLQPDRDRITNAQWATGRGESAVLEGLLQQRGLVDVIHGEETESGPDRDQLTYWQGEHGARLDRGYASRQELRWIVDVEVVAAQVETDHRGLVLWRRDPNLKPITSPLAPLAFPVHGRDPEQINDEIMTALSITLRAARKRQDPWDTVAAHS